MRALAFDFTWDDALEPAPEPQRRLYAVRGTAVDAPAATAAPRLELVLGGAWEALAEGSSPACPVCTSGTMAPRWSAGAGVTGGRCGDCGSTLG
jgi:hypothetical protein